MKTNYEKMPDELWTTSAAHNKFVLPNEVVIPTGITTKFILPNELLYMILLYETPSIKGGKHYAYISYTNFKIYKIVKFLNKELNQKLRECRISYITYQTVREIKRYPRGGIFLNNTFIFETLSYDYNFNGKKHRYNFKSNKPACYEIEICYVKRRKKGDHPSSYYQKENDTKIIDIINNDSGDSFRLNFFDYIDKLVECNKIRIKKVRITEEKYLIAGKEHRYEKGINNDLFVYIHKYNYYKSQSDNFSSLKRREIQSSELRSDDLSYTMNINHLIIDKTIPGCGLIKINHIRDKNREKFYNNILQLPTHIIYDERYKIKRIEYHKHGLEHRDKINNTDQPSSMFFKNGYLCGVYYRKNGIKTRDPINGEYLPTNFGYDISNQISTIMYHTNGELFRPRSQGLSMMICDSNFRLIYSNEEPIRNNINIRNESLFTKIYNFFKYYFDFL